ncbi:endolytic transglycosylase MltG [Halobacillus seohaensis]|uniref:Endolytic transglycosylase MltG n=1 Tax=Halobacillus seohaensis TaxID=447421 RepID=A0ABW2EGI8_9BACI
MKQPIRFFSFGMLLTTVILGIFYWLQPVEQAESVPSLSTEDMIEELESNNYNVLTDQEMQERFVTKQENEELESDKQESQDEQSPEDDQDNSEKDTNTFTISIEEGVSSTDISQTLENQGIIDDADTFDLYMRDRNLSQYVQIGKFELNADMNRDEIADLITN